MTENEKKVTELLEELEKEGYVIEEIGDKFGLTRERVRQIKEKAIRRLRHNTKNINLKAYLGQ